MKRPWGTRRDYLTATAVTVGTVSTGCLGRPADDRRTRTARDSNAALREELGVQLPAYDLEDELRVYQWVNYWPSRVVRNFERAFGVSVEVETYPSNEVLRDTLANGGAGAYDVVFPSDYMVTILANEGLIRPLDLESIPNWSNLERKWVTDAPYDPGPERYSAPFQWGTTGVGWHEALVDGPITSWDAMWDERYAGQITWLNDMRETLGAALKRLGYSLNTRDEDEILEAKETLLQQRDLVSEFDSEFTEDFLVNREASPVHTWSGEAFIAYWNLYRGSGSPIEYRIPEEGGVVWIDTAAIPRDAPHPNAAHAFVDYLLAAKPGAAVSNYVRYGTPNEAAKEYIEPRMLENPGVYPPEDVLSKLEFIEDVGPAIDHYQRAWSEVVDARRHVPDPAGG